MRILGISLLCGSESKTLTFDDCTTLIHSKKNGVGKSTLIRAILYALGEPIPSTKFFPLEKCATLIDVVTGQNVTLRLIRDINVLRVVEDGVAEVYHLEYERHSVRRRLYGLTNLQLLENILGAFFIDQDIGWTMLNRGKLIGDVHFSIEGFIEGVSGHDLTSLRASESQAHSEVEKYSFIVDAARYSEAHGLKASHATFDPCRKNLADRESQLLSQKSMIEKDIRKIKDVQRRNKQFGDYVSSMKLQVIAPSGDFIKVTSENLRGFEDNSNYLEARILTLRGELYAIEQELYEVQGLLASNEQLFDIESDILSFDRRIASLNLSVAEFQPVLDSLKKQRKEIRRQIREELSPARNNAARDLTAIVADYMNRLGIGKLFRSDSKGVFTRDLALRSGSNYHLSTFAFRMGYAKIIDQNFGLRLPIILDSPRSGELDSSNFELMMELLRREFANHQVIIASIFDSDVRPDKTISIENRVMEHSDIITDRDTWEKANL